MVGEYRTLAGPGAGQYLDRRSRFLGFAWPVASGAEVEAQLTALRGVHHAARHICYAYVLGPEGAEWRANDDGEPSGTGGRPILGVLRSRGLTEALVAVVRYFGGIKLGVPGLIAAYRGAAEVAVTAAGEQMRTVEHDYIVEFDYAVQHEVVRVVKATSGRVMDADYGVHGRVVVRWPVGEVQAAEGQLTPLVSRFEALESGAN